jgi:cytochrome c-type biogenesis protein CcmF
VAAALLPALVAAVMGRISAGVAVGLGLAGWVFAATAVLLWARSRAGAGQLVHASRGFWGMVIAHLGVGVFVVGVTLVRGYETERDVRMAVGDQIELAGYRYTFRGVAETTGPNYVAVRATVEVQPGAGGTAFVLMPEKRLYKVQPMPMTEAAIDIGLTRDLYVSLGEPLDERTWTLRIYHKPFIDWIWGGTLLMALGGFLALADRRYRVAVPAATPQAVPAPALQEARS